MPIDEAPAVATLFSDDFATDPNGPISASEWSYTTGNAENIPSTVPGGPPTEGTPTLPSVSNGALQLHLETYNPTGAGTSFQGDDAYTNQSFTTAGGGVAFTSVAEFATPLPSGGTLDGGFFPYLVVDDAGDKNEIDFEALSNQPTEEQTNFYVDAPANSAGDPTSVSDPGITSPQTYTIEWFPNAIYWFIDGQLVRTDTTDVPQSALQLYLNIWGYAPGAGLEPAATPQTSTTYTFAVQDVSVTSIEATPADFTSNVSSDLLMTSTSTGALVVDAVSNGQEAYSQIGGLGSAWQFEGDGNLLGDGNERLLLWNSSTGAVVVAEDGGGTAAYTQISGVGSVWQFEGTGPFADQANSDFLLRNSSTGALVVGAVSGEVAQYTQIGGVGSNWNFEGTGDYLGDGRTGFLMEDSNTGTLVVGEDVSGTAQYTAVGGLGAQWVFEGSGDLLGHGQDDFLIWNNSTDALVVGEIANGAAQYTPIGAVGAEWQFLGVGDFDGAGEAEFMMRNGGSGALVIATVAATNGPYGVTYAAVGGVGSEWNFHTANVATLT